MSSEHMAEVSLAALEDERLHLLREEDLQRWLERASAMCKQIKTRPHAENLLALRPSQTPVARERLLGEACAIGDQLCRRAIKYEDMAVWMSPTLITRSHEWEPRSVGTGWYEGIAGIALFLGYLAQMTGEQRYRTLTMLAVQSVRCSLEISYLSVHPSGGTLER